MNKEVLKLIASLLGLLLTIITATLCFWYTFDSTDAFESIVVLSLGMILSNQLYKIDI